MIYSIEGDISAVEDFMDENEIYYEELTYKSDRVDRLDTEDLLREMSDRRDLDAYELVDIIDQFIVYKDLVRCCLNVNQLATVEDMCERLREIFR